MPVRDNSELCHQQVHAVCKAGLTSRYVDETIVARYSLLVATASIDYRPANAAQMYNL